jgi:hypothetical protein
LPPTVSKTELHAAVSRITRDFFTRADASAEAARTRHAEREADPDIEPGTPAIPPPRVVITAETGSRKTGITLKMAAAWIETRKAAGLPHRLIYLVPALRPDETTPDKRRLGQQILARARAEGIDAALFLGRGDTSHPDKPGQPCRNLLEVGLARNAGADVRQSVCGTLEGPRCAFLERCRTDGYLAGEKRATAADLVIAAHAFMFDELPRGIREGGFAVVIDEAFTSDKSQELTLDTLVDWSVWRAPVLDGDGGIDRAGTDELVRLLARVVTAARACPDGYLTAEALREAGFTAADAAEARRLLWRRGRDVRMWPGMRLEDRTAEARRAAVNGQLPALVSLTRALEDVLTRGQEGAGLVSVHLDTRRTGSQIVLTMRGQRAPAAWLAEMPVLMLNATARVEDARRVFPDAEPGGVPRAEAPHALVHQRTGCFGRRFLEAHPERIAELRDFIRMIMIGKTFGLVITHQSIEHLFQGIPGVITAHHGDIAGSDQYAHVEAIFIIGGSFPGPAAVADIAAARGGGAVRMANPRRMTRVARLVSGEAVAIQVMGYEDPAAEAVHRGIYDTSVTQALGRPRPLERTATNPSIAYVMANVVTDRPVMTLGRFQDAKPDRLVKMVLRGTVLFNAAHAAMLHPGLFRTPKAFERARENAHGTVADMIAATKAITRKDFAPWFLVTYQMAGQGNKWSQAVVRDGGEAGLRAALEAALGALVLWRVRSFTQGLEHTPMPGISNTYKARGSPFHHRRR